MGLYDGNKLNLRLPEFNFDFEWRKLKWPVLGIAAAVLVAVIAFSIFLAVQPKPLEASLSPNPLNLAKGFDSYLTITVNNTTEATASNVLILVETEASDAITIFPRTRTIPTLGKGETRTLKPFAISPNPTSEIYSGTYILTVTTVINGQSFTQKVNLQVEAV